jgi:hypothetical protein
MLGRLSVRAVPTAPSARTEGGVSALEESSAMQTRTTFALIAHWDSCESTFPLAPPTPRPSLTLVAGAQELPTSLRVPPVNTRMRQSRPRARDATRPTSRRGSTTPSRRIRPQPRRSTARAARASSGSSSPPTSTPPATSGSVSSAPSVLTAPCPVSRSSPYLSLRVTGGATRPLPTWLSATCPPRARTRRVRTPPPSSTPITSARRGTPAPSATCA